MTRGSQSSFLGGIEAGGTKFICGIADWDGNILDRVHFPTKTPAETLATAAQFFEDAFPHYGSLAALSIGSFGPLSLQPAAPNFGHITATPKAGWGNTDLLGYFKRRMNVPMAIDTDVNCAALAEHLFGSGRGLDTFCYVTVGTGIGVGMIVDGAPYGGANHPEAGHIRVPRAAGDGTFKGTCPFHGDCLEGLASGPAMQERWNSSPADLPDDHPAWVIEAEYLAALCTNLTYIMRPAQIIIGGGVMQRPRVYQLLRATLEKRLAGYDASLRNLDLESYVAEPTAGTSAGLYGALAAAYRLVAREWPLHWHKMEGLR